METIYPSEAKEGGATSDPNPFAIGSPGKSPRREWGWWPSLVTAIALILFFAPVYAYHMNLSADSGWFNEDARQQIWTLLRYNDGRLFKNDQVANYYLACFPILYHQSYHLVGPFWKATSASKVIPYVLLAIMIWCVGQSARRLRGPAAGWAAVALCLGAQVYLSRMAGGLPRSFAFPILAIGFFALARGKPILLAVVTIIGAGFYPSAASVTGLALAAWMLMPAQWLGKSDGWAWWRRLAVLGSTLVLSILIMLPTLLASGEYGSILTAADVQEYPEVSVTGQYHEQDTIDQNFSLRSLENFIHAPLAGIGGPWNPTDPSLAISKRAIYLLVLALMGLTGYVLLLKNSPPGRRILLIPIAGILYYFAAVLLYPKLYIPARYQLYPLALSAAIMVPAGLAHLSTVVIRHTDQRRTQSLVALAVIGPFILLFTAWNLWGPNRGLSSMRYAGLTHERTENTKLYEKIRELKPQSTLIAGWPKDLDDVPYATGRSVLITYDGHQVFHKQFADEMRLRMDAVIEALFGTELSPTISLAREYGVTHLVINRKKLYNSPAGAPKPPKYFPPYDETIALKWKKLKDLQEKDPDRMPPFFNPVLRQPKTDPKLSEQQRQPDISIYYEDENWIILDIRRLRVDEQKSAGQADQS